MSKAFEISTKFCNFEDCWEAASDLATEESFDWDTSANIFRFDDGSVLVAIDPRLDAYNSAVLPQYKVTMPRCPVGETDGYDMVFVGYVEEKVWKEKVNVGDFHYCTCKAGDQMRAVEVNYID